MISDACFGVIVCGYQLAAWQVRCIADLVQGGAQLQVVVWAEPVGSARNGRRGAWRLLEAYAAKNVPGLGPVDWRREYRGVEVINANVDNTGQLSLSRQLHTVLRERRLEFLLNFADKAIAPDLFDVPTAGVWSFQLNDVTKFDGRLPGFWEICRGDKLIRCALVRYTRQGAMVLRAGTFRSVVDSYVATASTALNACVPWPRLAWRVLAHNGRMPDASNRLCHVPSVSADPPTQWF